MSTSVEMPDEMWLETLSDLSYFELKKCMRVSKRFQALLRFSTFDDKLFQSKIIITPGDPIDLASVRVHPAFNRLSYECATEIEHAYFLTSNADDQYDEQLLSTTAAAKEQATFPAVNHLRFQIHD